MEKYFSDKDYRMLYYDSFFKTFANSILSYLNEPKKIINMVDRGKEALASLSWKQTADEFLAILEMIFHCLHFSNLYLDI